MMTDFRLKVFKAVAEHLSYTRTATTLCITQPAVSKHIRELEKQLGVALFIREGNKISLTSAGRKLLVHASRILACYHALNDDFADDDTVTRGSIAIGSSTTITQYILPAILAGFKQQHQNVRISLLNANSEQVEKMVESDQIDIGLIEGDARNPNLHYEAFTNDRIVLVTSADNKRYREADIHLLRHLPLVLRENGSGTLDVIDSSLARNHVYRKDLNIIIQLGSTEAIKRYLFHSDAYALLSIASVGDELASGSLHEIKLKDIEILRVLRFVSMHGKNSRLVSIFKEFCIRENN